MKGFLDFVIEREPYGDTLTLKLPIGDGQTYYMDCEEMRDWMRRVGVSMSIVDRTLDYVWNFYKVRVDLVAQRFVGLS